jgi:hypothetical protein
MVKFFLRLLLLGSLLLVTNIIIIFFAPVDPTYNYFASMIDKHARLEQAKSPKVVLIGGSNVAFGIDSEMIEAELGMPVVNMGLQGGLGLRYMLSETKPKLAPGDIVILMPEYEQYLFLFNGQVQLWQVLNIIPENTRFITHPRQYLVMLRNYPKFVQGKLKGALLSSNKQDPIYYREAFNQYGDITSHLSQPSKQIEPKIWYWGSGADVDKSIAVLNQYYSEISANDVRGFIIPPSIAQTGYAANKDRVTMIYKKLLAQSNMPVLANPNDYVYPDQLFFDTIYHLHSEGRSLRTQQVINDVSRALEQEVGTSSSD